MSPTAHLVCYVALLAAAGGAAYGMYQHGKHVARGEQAADNLAALQQAVEAGKAEQDRANRLGAELETAKTEIQAATGRLQAQARDYAKRRQAQPQTPTGAPQAFGLDAEGVAIWNAGGTP